MKEYVLGFLFDQNDKVLLIKKTKPANLAGKWNGVGGKLEIKETYLEAMARETREETGIKEDIDWKWFAMIPVSTGMIYCYCSRVVDMPEYFSPTEELVSEFHIDSLPKNLSTKVLPLIDLSLLKLQSRIEE